MGYKKRKKERKESTGFAVGALNPMLKQPTGQSRQTTP